MDLCDCLLCTSWGTPEMVKEFDEGLALVRIYCGQLGDYVDGNTICLANKDNEFIILD